MENNCMDYDSMGDCGRFPRKRDIKNKETFFSRILNWIFK
jgi:hypothetical protein